MVRYRGFNRAAVTFLLLIGITNATAQRGSLWLGAEFGANIADNSPYNTISSQGGIVGEFYFARQWSVAARLKYCQTNIDYYSPGYSSTSTGIGSNEPARRLDYKAKNIIFPIDLKWNFRIYNKFYGALHAGSFANFTTDSKWTAENIEFSPKKFSIGIDSGIGLHYQLNAGSQIFASYDYFHGGSNGKIPSYIFDSEARQGSHQISIGYQFALRSQ